MNPVHRAIIKEALRPLKEVCIQRRLLLTVMEVFHAAGGFTDMLNEVDVPFIGVNTMEKDSRFDKLYMFKKEIKGYRGYEDVRTGEERGDVMKTSAGDLQATCSAISWDGKM